MGAESCRKCHAEVYNSWLNTSHAAAYSTIAKTDQWNNPDCLLCHTTGYGEMGDSESGMIDPKFRNVQCEACRRMGAKHARQAGTAKVAEHVCRKCHNQSSSPEFDYKGYLHLVVH